MNLKLKTKISKKMCYYLRHNLDQIPDRVDTYGYVSIKSLLSMSDFTCNNVTKNDIIDIVRSCEKQRFDIDKSGTRIRANQGHSEESGKLFDPTKLLTKIETPLEYCVHGTRLTTLKEIKKSGLNRMSRTHIHFASSPDAISGFRSSSEVLIYLDMEKAMMAGIEFYMSKNDVILSEGPIPVEFFKEIIVL